jgi:hypothetical protein
MSHKLPLADIQFISDFAVFARSKGHVAYDYLSNTNCAACQFLKHTGRAKEPSVGGNAWREIGDAESARQRMPDIDMPALCEKPWTFSALADRLEALIADAPMVTR